MNILKNKRGNLSGLALGLVVAVVALFIGLYMISQVSSIFSVDPTSDFYTIYKSLITNSMILVPLGGVTMVMLLRFGQEGKETTASI
ncbi:MAG: hypothetical protein J7L08_00030 [Candidatus Aenigmarchaeota archaeon]|nr:hypothetical protein [Candidatus Aenigmarchaeota archaeon]